MRFKLKFVSYFLVLLLVDFKAINGKLKNTEIAGIVIGSIAAAGMGVGSVYKYFKNRSANKNFPSQKEFLRLNKAKNINDFVYAGRTSKNPVVREMFSNLTPQEMTQLYGAKEKLGEHFKDLAKLKNENKLTSKQLFESVTEKINTLLTMGPPTGEKVIAVVNFEDAVANRKPVKAPGGAPIPEHGTVTLEELATATKNVLKDGADVGEIRSIVQEAFSERFKGKFTANEIYEFAQEHFSNYKPKDVISEEAKTGRLSSYDQAKEFSKEVLNLSDAQFNKALKVDLEVPGGNVRSPGSEERFTDNPVFNVSFDSSSPEGRIPSDLQRFSGPDAPGQSRPEYKFDPLDQPVIQPGQELESKIYRPGELEI